MRDKTLAGKNAIFDVTVLEASKRTLPEVTDEFANNVRAGLTAESLREELRTAVDSEDAKEFRPARNAALAKALAEVMDVDVPDTLVTGQAREKYALFMSDMRASGVPDEEIKKQISPENFLKYKKIVKDDIIKDFKVSMAVDEIGRTEGIEVPESQVAEQMEAVKEQAAEDEENEMDEAQIRARVENTLQREAVMDFLAENADLELIFEEEQDFDEELMAKLAAESLAREEEAAAEAAAVDEGESAPVAAAKVVDAEPEVAPEKKEKEAVPEPVAEKSVEEEAAEAPDAEKAKDRDYANMSVQEKAYFSLLDSGALDQPN